jgi:hypothetical protein
MNDSIIGFMDCCAGIDFCRSVSVLDFSEIDYFEFGYGTKCIVFVCVLVMYRKIYKNL